MLEVWRRGQISSLEIDYQGPFSRQFTARLRPAGV
jgi:hypothetical protein